MSLQIKGKVYKVLPVITGNKQDGSQWQKQDFVIETSGQYPQKVCFTAWTKLVEMSKNLKQGQEITVHFEPSSREYEERWYTELKAWRIDADTIVTNSAPPAQKADDGDIPW